MKKEYSLKGRRLFKETIYQGKRIKRKGFYLYVLHWDRVNSDIKEHRRDYFSKERLLFGISIGRKFGNAPQRNRAKRRLRSIIDGIKGDAVSGYCVILRPSFGLNDVPYADLQENIIKTLLEVGVIGETS